MRSYVKQNKKRRSPAATKNLTELFQMWVITVIILIMMCGVWIFFRRYLHSDIPIPGRDACSETVFHVRNNLPFGIFREAQLVSCRVVPTVAKTVGERKPISVRQVKQKQLYKLLKNQLTQPPQKHQLKEHYFQHIHHKQHQLKEQTQGSFE